MVMVNKHPRLPVSGTLRRLIFAAVAATGLYMTLDAKPVVDYLFAFGDYPSEYFDPRGFPLPLDRLVEASDWREIPLPDGVLQPSGLGVSGDAVVFSTDMSSLHLAQLQPQEAGSLPLDTIYLRRGPLLWRQGYLEAASFGADRNELFAVGGNDQLFQLSRSADKLTLQSSVTLGMPGGSAGAPEISGLTYRAQTDTLFAAYSTTDNAGVAVAEYARSGTLLRSLTLHSAIHDAPVLAALLNEANVAGLTVIGDHLVVLSDQHSVLLWFDIATGRLVNVWGLDGIENLSGIAHEDGKLFVVRDHEYYQDAPPLRVLTLTDLPK